MRMALAVLPVGVIALSGFSQTTYVKAGLTDPVETVRQRKIDEGTCTQEAYAAIPQAPSTRVVVNTAPSRPASGGFAGGFADGFARAQSNSGGGDSGYSARETVKEGCMARLGWSESRA